jgi:hypothetical protein
MKPKKLFGFENKKSLWISGRSQVDISPISFFFASHSLNRRQNSHSVFRREISKLFLPSDFIFGILFEHQFNNLIEFSENNILWSEFLETCGNMKITFGMWVWMNKIIKICVAYPIYFLNPCENFHHKKSYFGRSSFFGHQQLSKFPSGVRLKIFHMGSQIPI